MFNAVARARRLIQISQRLLIQHNLEEPKPILSSYPFITGDTFLSSADTALITKKGEPFLLKKTDRKNILFSEVDYLLHKEYLALALEYKVVIAHNGDTSLPLEIVKAFAKAEVYLYATNIKPIPPYVWPIPIGIENCRLRKNGSMHHFNVENMFSDDESHTKSNHIIVSFSVATNEQKRIRYQDKCHKYGLLNRSYPLNDYRKLLSASMFVICPPGNGIDCHRMWEAFYFRTIPVIERQDYLFAHLSLPVVVVDDLESFLDLSPDQRIQMYNRKIQGHYDAIFFDYWLALIHMPITNPDDMS